MIKKSRVSQSFLRYLILYVLFAAFTFASYVPIYMFISHNMLDQMLDQYQLTLSSSANTLDGTINALNNAVAVTYRDPRFRKFRYQSISMDEINYIDFNALKDLLNGLVISHSLVSDTAILFSEDVVLTRQRSFINSSFYSYYPDFMACDAMNYEQWREWLQVEGRILPVMNYSSADYGCYEALTYTSPWSDQYGKGRSRFIATLPVNRILALLIPRDMRAGAYLRIANADGTALCEYGSERLQDCLVVTCQTDLWRLNIELGIPRSVLEAEASSMRRVMIIFGSTVMIIALVLIWLFAYHSARPMRVIFNTMLSGEHTGQVLKNQIANPNLDTPPLLREYRALDNSLLYINERMEYHDQIIRQQKAMLKNQMMDMALRTGLYSPENLRLFNEVFPAFPKRYQIALIYYKAVGTETTISIAQIQADVLKVLERHLPEVHAQGFDGAAILLLLSAEGETDGQARLRTLCEELSANYQMAFSFSISEVFDIPQDLARAYQQIQYMNTARCGDNSERGDATGRHKVQLPLTVGTMQILYGALNNGNEVMALNILAECVEALPEPEDYVLQKHTYTMLANLLVQLKLENPILFFDVILPTFDQTRQRSEFSERFGTCFGRMCDAVIRAHQADTFDSDLELIRFIDDNLKNPNLCVNMVTDQYNISAPTLQKIVKRLTGSTFSVYVEEKRLSMAYTLLTEDQYSVQTVAEMCGFSSANSFYKVFKRRYGVSPGKVGSQ